MPNLTFVLPHWLYWFGLVAFPLLAMMLVKMQNGKDKRGQYNLSIGYMILVVGGFLGLHRFYFKNFWGLIFLPLFFFIFICKMVSNAPHALCNQA